jgi:hypothetical protein
MNQPVEYRYVGMVNIPQRTMLGEQIERSLKDLRSSLTDSFPMSGFRIGVDRSALWVNVEAAGGSDDQAIRMKLWEFGQSWSDLD